MKRRIFALALAAIMALTLASCSIFTTEEVLTIYVASETHSVDCIAIAPEPDVMNSKEKIVLFDYLSLMRPQASEDYHINVPNSKLDGTWYIYVSGAVNKFLEMYSLEQEVGTLFDGDVYGFSIDFDAEAENFVLTPLSGV